MLITGASGEIGHGLIERIAQQGDQAIITLDLRPLDPEIGRHVQHQYMGSILDVNLLERILAEFEVDLVFHLAALLSTRGEFAPTTAHQVNVEGTLRMLEFAQKEGESHGRPVVFMYPSLDRRLRPARPGDQGAGGTGPRGRVEQPDHHVRLQQAVLRAPRPVLPAPLPAARGGDPRRQGGLPVRPLPRADLRR